MLYEKPKDVRYTDMAIFIDENIYKEDLSAPEINLIFEYLYHLSYMLARKRNFFTKAHYYDDFSVYLATYVYLRLTNKKQFNEDKKLDRVKSVLNYLKSVLYPIKVQFEQENYYQGIHIDDIKEDSYSQISLNFLDGIVDEISLFNIDLYFDDVTKTIKNFLSNIPYSKDQKIWNNIYISCLLTILNPLVFSNIEMEKIKNMKYNNGPNSNFIEDLYEKNRGSTIILYRLPESMKNYISVLCNEIRHLIACDISMMLDECIDNDSNQYLMLKEINGISEDFGDD